MSDGGKCYGEKQQGEKTRGRRRAGRSFEFLSGCQGSPSDMWTKVWRRWEGELWQYLGIRRGKSKNRSYEVGICRVCWKNSQNARMRRGWAGGVVCITVQEVKRTCRTSHITIWTNLIFFFLKPCHKAYRILVLLPGIEPALSAVEVWSSNHWAARKVPVRTNLYSKWFEAS